MAFHDFFSSGAVAISQRHDSGTFAPGAVGGTGNPVFAGNHNYHAAIFIGTLSGAAAVGSMIVYGHTSSTGDGTTALGTLALTAGTGAAVFDFKTDTLLGLGTAYTYISAQLLIATGSVDCRGALFIESYDPRSAGTTPAANGIRSLGTLYS
jgi:hypothetical protein